MKKMYTRFLTLVMALVMVFSCTAVVSAAESPVGIDNAYAGVSSCYDGVMPLASFHTWYEDTSSTAPHTGSFTINNIVVKSSDDIHLAIASNVVVEVKIYANLSTSPVRTYRVENTNNTAKMFSLGSGYSGGVYRFVFTPIGTGKYTIALCYIA